MKNVSIGFQPKVGNHRQLHWLLTAVAAVPVAFILTQIVQSSRNIAFWDEFDSVLALVLRLDAGVGWREFGERLFQLDSEHRTVTSRLIVAASYGLTGRVNFDLICALSNLALFTLCLVLVASVPTVVQRVQLGVLLAFGLFQLEHYETFFWSGAIDHFLVLMLAGGALAALARSGPCATVGAGLLAMLATFTLAHGCLLWPLGAAILWRAGRQRELLGWGALAALVLTVFFYGFQIDASHRLHDYSPAGLGRLAQFWLALLGGPLTFGERSLAPAFGLLLLVLLGWLGARGAWHRQPVVMPMACFAVASLALVAFGRLEVAGTQIQSRYLVLGSLAWSLTAFMLIEGGSSASRPYRLLVWSLPALVAFNVAANVESKPYAESWTVCRNSAVRFFMRYGRDGIGPHTLYPNPERATLLLRQVEETGIFTMPILCPQKSFPNARPVADISYYVDRINVEDQIIAIEGWAAFPGLAAKPNEVNVVLRSRQSQLIFAALPVERADVATAFPRERWRDSGFRFQRRRWLLPKEDFQIGLLINSERGAKFIMTAHRLDLTGDGHGILAGDD